MADRRTSSDTLTSSSSSGWKSVLRIDNAHDGRLYAIRLRGQNVTYRLIADGHAGRETVVSGTIAAGDPTTVRLAGIPETIGAATLLLEARLTTGSTAVDVRAEASWLPISCPCEGV